MELRSPSRRLPFILERLSPTRERVDTHHHLFVSDAADAKEMLQTPEIRNVHVIIMSVGLRDHAGLDMAIPLTLLECP